MNDPVQFQMLDLETSCMNSSHWRSSVAESIYWCLLWVVNSYIQESMQTARFTVSVGKMIYYIHKLYIYTYKCAIRQLQYTLVIHCPWSCSELRAKQRLNQGSQITFIWWHASASFSRTLRTRELRSSSISSFRRVPVHPWSSRSPPSK